MHCVTKKVDILSLLIHANDRFTIANTFDILQRFTQILKLIKKIICDKKVIMLKGNLLII